MIPHTPGPWTESAHGGDAVNVIVARDADGKEIPVAVVTRTDHASETLAANRRLIAAAPLLFDACVAATGHLNGEGDDNRDRVCDALYLALKRAIGRESANVWELWNAVNPMWEGVE